MPVTKATTHYRAYWLALAKTKGRKLLPSEREWISNVGAQFIAPFRSRSGRDKSRPYSDPHSIKAPFRSFGSDQIQSISHKMRKWHIKEQNGIVALNTSDLFCVICAFCGHQSDSDFLPCVIYAFDLHG
jgi:hypothetical protein